MTLKSLKIRLVVFKNKYFIDRFYKKNKRLRNEIPFFIKLRIRTILDFDEHGIDQKNDKATYFILLKLLDIAIPDNELNAYQKYKNTVDSGFSEVKEDKIIKYYVESFDSLDTKNLSLESFNITNKLYR